MSEHGWFVVGYMIGAGLVYGLFFLVRYLVV